MKKLIATKLPKISNTNTTLSTGGKTQKKVVKDATKEIKPLKRTHLRERSRYAKLKAK